MTFEELVDRVAADSGAGKTQVRNVLTALQRQMAQALAAGEPVRLPDLGRFAVAERGPLRGRNFRTGAPIEIPARRTVRFAAQALLRRRVRGG